MTGKNHLERGLKNFKDQLKSNHSFN